MRQDEQGGGSQGGGSQGGGSQGGGSQGQGFAGMDDEQQRDLARQGGEESVRQQERDEQGQFAGTGGQAQGDQGSQSGR